MVGKKSFFYKLFLSSCLLLLVPAFTLFVFYYYKNISHLKTEIIQYNINRVNQIKETFDERIRECNNIAAFASLNSKLSKKNIEKEPYSAMEGIIELRKYMAGNEFIDDLFIYYANNPLLYSASGTTSVDVILKYRYGFSEDDYRSCLSIIEKARTISLCKFDSSDVVVYIRPLSISKKPENGVAVFIFEGKSIRNLLGSSYPGLDGMVYITNEDREIIMSSDKRDNYFPDEMIEKVIIGQVEEGYDSKSLVEGDFSFISVNSEQTLLSYSIVVSTDLLMSQVITKRVIAVAVIALVSIVCLFISWVFAMSNYRPIRQLNKKAAAYLPELQITTENEIESIGLILENVTHQNRALNATFEYHKDLLKNNILAMLLRGEFSSAHNFQNVADEIDFNFPHSAFAVMAIDISNDELSKYNGKIIDYISAQSGEDETCYAVEVRNDNVLAVIYNVEEERCREKQCMLAGAICDFYRDAFGEKVHLGIGKTYLNVLNIGNSYAEACSVATRLYGEGDMYGFFEEILCGTFQLGEHFAEDKVFYTHCLKQGNLELADSALDKLMGDIIGCKLSGAEEKYECYILLNDVIKCTNDFWKSNSDSSFIMELSDKFYKCLHYSSLEDYRTSLKALSSAYCHIVSGMIDVREEELKRKLLKYIAENFKDPNLSLDSVSQIFGYSRYYWSRYFKEHFRCLFSDYIWRLRLDAAKTMIKESNKAIKDIVLEVGYIDATAFIKKFKNEEGVTPGQYRKMNKVYKI